MKNFFGFRTDGWSVTTFCGVLAALVLMASCGAGEPDLSWEQAWIRPMPPGAGMTAAYGILRNPGRESLAITGFSSKQFADISLHETRVENGVSRMTAIPELRLAPGETLHMKPAGAHLMLMDPGHGLDDPQSVEISVYFQQGEQSRAVTFSVAVGG